MSEQNKKVRKVFLDELPRWRFGKGQINGVINWSKSIGYKIKFVYDDIEGYITIVGRQNKYLYVKYLDEDSYKIHIDSFSACQLGKMLDVITTEFRIKIGQVFKDEYRNITILNREYINGKKCYKYRCNKCGFDCTEHYKDQNLKKELWTTEYELLNGSSCACCSNSIVVTNINSIVTTASFMIPYFADRYNDAKMYTKTSNKRIYPICPDCGRIKAESLKIADIYKNHSIGCGCSDGYSYPNKLMFNVLEQLEIDFIPEYSPDWIKPRRYDFYIPSINKIIEMDGSLGHGKSIHKESKITKEESLEIDIYKDKLAKEHGIEVIRINCDKSELELIKQNILSSELVSLIDIHKTDWFQCHEFSCSNRVKEACDYWNGGIESTVKIASIMKINRATVNNYLKEGAKINWCSYIPKNGRKQVEVFKDDISLGIFSSCRELERKSYELFGIKLYRKEISEVCLRKTTQYKNYIFKYIEIKEVL